jgi:hypothetical protein
MISPISDPTTRAIISVAIPDARPKAAPLTPSHSSPKRRVDTDVMKL